jgi:hypothetical protein
LGMVGRSPWRSFVRDHGVDWLIERWRQATGWTHQRHGVEELQGHPRVGMDRIPISSLRNPRTSPKA